MSGEQSTTFLKIKKLIEKEKVLISNHGYDELATDGLGVGEILQTIDSAVVLEDYPDFRKGPVVLITAYRPDPERWSEDFTRRA